VDRHATVKERHQPSRPLLHRAGADDEAPNGPRPVEMHAGRAGVLLSNQRSAGGQHKAMYLSAGSSGDKVGRVYGSKFCR
jgi:hypothetical protein